MKSPVELIRIDDLSLADQPSPFNYKRTLQHLQESMPFGVKIASIEQIIPAPSSSPSDRPIDPRLVNQFNLLNLILE